MTHHKYPLRPTLILLLCLAATTAFAAAPPAPSWFTWATVVNNEYTIPGTQPPRTFNSYNEPSVNANGLVVFRARSRGGGGTMATQGIYTRNMAIPDSEIVRIFDRTIPQVPWPNNLGTTFVEPPSFPRIDRWGETIVTRANHQPVWSYVPEGETEATRAGTNGIYATPYGELITAASKLGAVPGFDYFAVPASDPPIFFDVFPGAPAVTNGATIVFKGNYTVSGTGQTGAYYRDLEEAPAGGSNFVERIADTFTNIPGANPDQTFGSVSPPSADGNQAVFTAFDDEQNPNLGGIYLAPIIPNPPLTPLVEIGSQVPGETGNSKFTNFGEGLSFDGQKVGFWGTWGTSTRTVRLYCPEEGNKARIAYCNHTEQFVDDPITGETKGDPASVCDDLSDQTDRCYQEVKVPINQGIFVCNIHSGRTVSVAKTGEDFYDFMFWKYSGRVPGMEEGSGEGDEGDDGEPVRWHSSAFVAVSGPGSPPFNTVFKATKKSKENGEIVGIYLGWKGVTNALTVLETTMGGRELDPRADREARINELGMERESFRNGWLVITARIGVEGGTEEEGMAGIYLTRVPAGP